MPNGLGGFGLPRYMKQSMEYAGSEGYEPHEDTELTVQPNDTQRATGGPDQELSPTASEFKPNPTA